MATGVSLSLIKTHPSQWSGPNALEEIHRERLMGTFYLFSQPSAVHECLVDTGAMLTVLPKHVWEPHNQRIVRLKPTSQMTPIYWNSISGITGGGMGCDIGIVEIIIIDMKGRAIRRRIIAKLAHEDGIPRTLLGLGGNTYANGQLNLLYSKGSAYIY